MSDDEFFNPKLNRSPSTESGFSMAGVKQALRSSFLSPTQQRDLTRELMVSALMGQASDFQSAFLKGAPWDASTAGQTNLLGMVCSHAQSPIPLLCFLQSRGAFLLGPAGHHGSALSKSPPSKSYLFTPVVAINAEQWDTACYLASGAAKAFVECHKKRLSHPGQWLFSPSPCAKSEPGLNPKFVKAYGDQPLLQALEAICHILSGAAPSDSERLAPIERFLRTALDAEILRPLPAPVKKLLFNATSKDGRSLLSFAADFPGVRQALVKAGAIELPAIELPDPVSPALVDGVRALIDDLNELQNQNKLKREADLSARSAAITNPSASNGAEALTKEPRAPDLKANGSVSENVINALPKRRILRPGGA